jgi:hypothetical protein
MPLRTSPDRIAQLVASYLVADYRWEHDGVWRALRIGEPAPEVDAAFPDAVRFGLLTAANPGQQLRADIDNRSADRALQRRMDQHGLRYRPAFVAATNRVWRAYNWLVIAPEAEVFDALARDFGQIGTLLWSRGTPVRLRMHAAMPAACAASPHVDWVDPGHTATIAPAGGGEAKSARSP